MGWWLAGILATVLHCILHFFSFKIPLLHNPLSPVFIETVSLVDTGSTAPAFVDEDSLMKKYNITMKKLLTPKPLHLADRLPSGLITQYFTALMTMVTTQSPCFSMLQSYHPVPQ